MTMGFPRALLLSLLVVASGCASVTEIMVIVDTDLAIPTGIDAMRIRASVDGRPNMESNAPLGAADVPPPRTVVLAHRAGPLGPVRIEAEALLWGGVVVSTVRELAFEPGRTVTVRLTLRSACVGVVCGAGLTCSDGGACRPVAVLPCEVSGACADAGALDAPASPDAGTDAGTAEPDAGFDAGTDAGSDAGSDAGTDAGPACALARGVCGAPARSVVGERVTLAACDPLPPGVTVGWSVELPSGLFAMRPDILLDAPGAYVATATASAPAGCTAVYPFRAESFAPVSSANRPGDTRRDLAARLDMAFVATNGGPWAVTNTGWRDLRIGATGSLVTSDLFAVEVLEDVGLFAPRQNDGAITRARVAADLSSVAFTNVTLPSGDRSVRAMSVPFGGGRSGAMAPVAVATREGWTLLEGIAVDTLTARALGPVWDVASAVAIGLTAPPERGALWAATLTSGRNLAVGAGGAFAAGALVSVPGASLVRALAVDDRPGRPPRLWVCTEDAGVLLYDLSIDWAMRTTWPTPLATVPRPCRDIALDPTDGGAWVATTTGIVRLGPDAAVQLALGAAAGAPTTSVFRIYVAWDATRRQVWAMDNLGAVYRVEADL